MLASRSSFYLEALRLQPGATCFARVASQRGTNIIRPQLIAPLHLKVIGEVPVIHTNLYGPEAVYLRKEIYWRHDHKCVILAFQY